MRRAAFLATLVVALLFGALLLPNSPLRQALVGGFGRLPRQPSTRAATATEKSPGRPLRVAVSAMISPERTYGLYGDFFKALADRLSRPLDLKQRHTYSEVNDLVLRGEVDLAWICTGAWPHLSRAGAARLLAVPRVGGRATYHALVLSGPTQPKARNLLDLRGTTFAFTDPISLTGCLYPKHRLAESGLEAETFFSSTFFTHGHDRSIEAVRRGIAAGASVDSLVYDYLSLRDPKEIAGVRVLEKSPPLPIPPLVVPANTSDAEVLLLRRELAALAADPAGRALLEELLIDDFTNADERAYEALR